MQFTTGLISLLAAAASVRAIPSDKRQETPRIYAKFFDDNACLGTWLDDTVVSLEWKWDLFVPSALRAGS